MSGLNYSVRSREIVDLINALNGGRLILKSYFQRNLVWRDVHRKEFIDTVLKGLPFPQIFLARGGIDVETLQSYSCVVDGQQRLSAIRDFIAGEFDVEGVYFSGLDESEKTSFLKYEVAVIDFDLEPDDQLLQEIFQRLNRTYYSLSSVEKLSAEFAPSDLMVFAKTLIGEYNNFDDAENNLEDVNGNPFQHDPNIPKSSLDWAISNQENDFSDLIASEKVFSIQEIKRKIPLMIVLNIISTYFGGYYNRNNDIKKFLDKYKNETYKKDELFEKFCVISEKIFQRLPESSYWLNKANFFTIYVEILKYEINLKYSEKIVDRVLELEKNGIPADYLLAAREGVNNKKEREIRGEYIRSEVLDFVTQK